MTVRCNPFSQPAAAPEIRLELARQLSVAVFPCAEAGLYFDLPRDALPLLDANDVLRLLNGQPQACLYAPFETVCVRQLRTLF